tara:strand:+ start:1839 stop:2234 length:396 start_codon:yes stop_codon:yes gene_type:complete
VSKIFLGVIGVLIIATYYFYSQNQILVANNSALENAISMQEDTIKSLEKEFELQTKQLKDLTIKSQAAQRELNRYTQFIQNYELTAKILSDPVEMERKINNGTKHIMEDIEQISITIDDLDDGLQLQSSTN